MLTPLFTCVQDEVFVIVAITLSALCKVTTAVFNILDNEFTFHCAPYYLRLKFDQRITEGAGERAVFAVETNILTVYVPKERRGEFFTQLDSPAYLIATLRERRRLVELIGGGAGTGEEERGLELEEEEREWEEEEETEFRQRLPDPFSPPSGGDYGFAGSFSGLFARLDADVVAEVIDLPRNPDATTAAERRLLRLAAEARDWDEDAALLSFEDAEGEVARLMAYAPAHCRAFAAAPTAGGEERGTDSAEGAECCAEAPEGGEEADALLPVASGIVEVWDGNIAEFSREAPSIAVPRAVPAVVLSPDDQFALQRIVAPRLLFAPRVAAVHGLTLDLLLAEAYDDAVTEGAGCSESLWNVCKLSPALAWLDPADNAYDACVSFARRALVYPLHRHFALVRRVMASVGARLALGRAHVLQALLRVRALLAHAEHRHVLVTLFVAPLLGYWAGLPDADEQLRGLAREVHAHATRAAPEEERGEETGAPVLVVRERRKLQPITILTIGLPIEA